MARGILATEYGVDLARVTWVLSGELEHKDTLAALAPLLIPAFLEARRRGA